jgi:hypothetical protein
MSTPPHHLGYHPSICLPLGSSSPEQASCFDWMKLHLRLYLSCLWPTIPRCPEPKALEHLPFIHYIPGEELRQLPSSLRIASSPLFPHLQYRSDLSVNRWSSQLISSALAIYTASLLLGPSRSILGPPSIAPSLHMLVTSR